MPRIEQLKKEIKDEEILHDLATAFTEVSAGKIGVLKRKFKKNQDFFKEVSDLYRLVKASSDQTEDASKGVLAVAMTTNHRFYGVINLEVMKKFLSDTKKQKMDRMIIGKIGIAHLKSINFKKTVEKVVLDKDVPKIENLKKLLKKAKDYKKVLLFYPQFKTIYSQTPAVTDIAYSPTPAARETVEQSFRFIFEPELPKIVEFFEAQIRTILLQRVLLEVELSVTASRLQAMSRAKEHASKLLKKRQNQLTKKTHSQINARLLESLGRISHEINRS